MRDLSALDNPIWHALTSVHAPFSLASGLACRYQPDISPLAALRKPSEQAFHDLTNLVESKDAVGLFTTTEISVPEGWNPLMERWMVQMVYTGSSSSPTAPCTVLGENDVDAMLALVETTGPGPFRKRTIALGHYLGIRNASGLLVAMAGQRLRLNGCVEISAVCTDPAHRGRGYASALISAQIEHILESGNVPFLHVLEDNDNAKSVYEKLGFTYRTRMRLTVFGRIS